MINNKFKMILQNDETIKWCSGVKKGAFIIKNTFLGILISILAGLFVAQPVTIFSNFSTEGEMGFGIWPKVFVVVLMIGFIVSFIASVLNARNTFLCITNKRVIKRKGAFNNKFIHYSLKNVGTVEVSGSLFDSKGETGSADLLIAVKDFHMNTDGNSKPVQLKIKSLKSAYEAYRILSEMVDGNNESLRVESEK